MSYQYILYEVSDGVATITLNRPDKMNALLEEMGTEFGDAISSAKSNAEARALLVTGSGRGFCAGADVSRLLRQADGTGLVHALKDPTVPVGLWIHDLYYFPKPTIVAVNGIAAGAGVSIALSCDLRIGSHEAQLAAAWINRGIPPDTGTTWLLPRIIGLTKAMEVLYQGKALDAQQCADLGIFNRIVPKDRLAEEARSLARSIAAGPTIGLEFTKRALRQSLATTLAEALDFETYAQRVCFETDDFREAVQAFQQKREPDFKGR